MKYRSVQMQNGKPEFGVWTSDVQTALDEAEFKTAVTGNYAWAEDEQSNRVTSADVAIRKTDQLNAADIYSAARRVSSNGTAAKLIDAIHRAEMGE